MLFGAALGEYVWTVVADAAGHLGGGPVGADAASRQAAGRCVTCSASGACGARAPSSKPPTTSSSSAAARTASRPPTTCAQHGITDVAVLEKSYIGSGAAGRNTTILRSNYKTPEGARFYDASREALRGPLGASSTSTCCSPSSGHLTLAHSDRAMFVMAKRAEVNRLCGIDSRLIGPDEIAELAPAMHARRDATLSGHGRRSTTRRAGSSATTRSSGASRAAADAAAPRSTPTPR